MDTGGLDTPAPSPPGGSANLAFQLVRKEYFNVLFWSILVSSKRQVEDSAWFLCIDRPRAPCQSPSKPFPLREIAEGYLTVQSLLQHERTPSFPTGNSLHVNQAVSAEIRLVGGDC